MNISGTKIRLTKGISKDKNDAGIWKEDKVCAVYYDWVAHGILPSMHGPYAPLV
jgi:hypothetical protein